jgi:hypothetical protein
MEVFWGLVLYFLILCVAGWILMLILGAFGLTLGFWTCVGICFGISLLRLLL